MTIDIRIAEKDWPLQKPFRLSREVQVTSPTIECTISDGHHAGRGEASGVGYDGETQATMRAQIESIADAIRGGAGRDELKTLLPPGGARNAVDCALWDLDAKRQEKTIWQLLGWSPRPVTTVYTVGIDEPRKMRRDAKAHREFPVIKVKVGLDDPLEQVGAVNEGAPDAAIVIDANQAWTLAELDRYAGPLKAMRVEMIEQPLDSTIDEALRGYDAPLPICADESCATSEDLERLEGLYSMVNVKLDKTGGLTEALALTEKALALGFELMVGNMVGTSLAMAPSFVIAQKCRYVDIDGPLLLAEDCEHGLKFDRGRVDVFSPRLWG